MSGNLPTMKDVAQKAGVSVGTVSKVFNGIPVGKKYRDKVEKAAKALGYQVNLYARGMRTNKTATVALIVPEIERPFFSALAQHICAALTRREHRMLLYTTAFQPEIELDSINRARQNRVDGIIGLTYNPLRVDIDLSFVSVDHCLSPNIPCVASENYGGGYMAAEKLVELGCRHLAYLRVASPDSIENDEQGNGFKAVCHADRESFRKVGLTFEEKAFYDILMALRDQYNFEYGTDKIIDGISINEKCRSLAQKIKEIIEVKSSFADWLNNQIVRDQLKFDIKVCLIKNGYPPQYSPEVFRKVMEQVENFEENNL